MANGNNKERGQVQQFQLRLSTDEHRALMTFAKVTGTSANDVLRQALRDYLTNTGRRDEFEALLNEARDQYQVALEKLAHL